MNDFKSFKDFQREEDTFRKQKSDSQPARKIRVDSESTSESDNLTENNRGNEKLFFLSKHIFLIPGKIRLYLLAAAVLILSAFLILLFLPIPFGHIELRGAKNVTMENVLFEGNIDEPINTLQISASDVTKRLENDLRIEEVNIERKFPATIVINIIERKPTAIIQTEYGYAVIDKRGIVIRTESALTDGDYPMITGKKLDNILLGDKIEEPDVLNALEFINHLSEKGAKEFSEINIGNQKNLMAYTRNGISVRLGAAGDLGKQATLAENMVNDVEARGLSVEYLDANMANPFIKLKK